MTTIKRAAHMATIADRVETMIHEFSTSADRYHIHVEYLPSEENTVDRFTEWTREYHRIALGDEFFIIRRDDYDSEVLYAVNISCDSVLAAASELMDTVSNKF